MATYAAKGDRLVDSTVPLKSVKAVGGTNSGAGLSPSIWGDCPLLAAKIDPFIGWGMEDNFVDAGLSGTITTIISSAGLGRYLAFGGSNATITPDDALGGGLKLFLTDDNQAVSITTKQNPFKITSDAGSLWFEARVKFSTIVTNEQAWMVGLTSAITQTAAVPLTAVGAIADINFVGFHKPEANTTAFDASYKADGVTAVEVNSDIGTLVANTYVKLGMKFKDGRLSFFINGVEQTTKKTIPDDTGTDFPADVTMAPTFGLLAATGDDETGTIDWWKCYQLRA